MYSLETGILKVIGFVFEKFLLFLEMPPSPCCLSGLSDAGNRHYRLALVSARSYQGKTGMY